MHRTVITVNDTVLKTSRLLRDWILIFPTTKVNAIEVLANITVVIIFQHIDVSNQHVIHLKLAQ